MPTFADVDAGRAFVVELTPFFGSGKPVALVKQTKEGACPLLSLFNALSLAGEPHGITSAGIYSVARLKDVLLARMRSRSERLCALAGQGCSSATLTAVVASLTATISAGQEAMEEFATGIVLDVVFGGSEMHAETPATKVFSSCGVALLHAWLPEPGSALAAKLGDRSYEAVQLDCFSEEQPDLQLVDWLTNQPPWLLTEAGHRSVLQAMAEEQLAV
jgi:hypothetical protein